jgi:hypothetical protein
VHTAEKDVYCRKGCLLPKRMLRDAVSEEELVEYRMLKQLLQTGRANCRPAANNQASVTSSAERIL